MLTTFSLFLYCRFCYPCQRGFRPHNLTCVLCPHTGGAYKRTAAGNDTWVHALCEMWIPELHESEDKDNKLQGPKVHTEKLNRSRCKLKCVICNSKNASSSSNANTSGASVQCCYKKCLTAVHPYCALKTPGSQFTWRVVESTLPGTTDESYFVRQLFCPSHANAVGQPLKNQADMVIQVRVCFCISMCIFPFGGDHVRI